MDWLQIIVLSLIQGITEFLPISSSAHLILPAQLTDWPDQGLAFDVGVHFGTLLAVVAYFFKDLWAMAHAGVTYPLRREYTPEIDLMLKLGLATLPVAVVGFLAKDFIEANLRSLFVIAMTTIGFGLLLWWSDRRPGRQEVVTWLQAAGIGAAQVFALIPGTSRSGVTITAAMLLGLSRTASARFSFLLAIPTIAGAQLLLMSDLAEMESSQRWGDLVAGMVISGISAYACIRFFIALVERTGMTPYVIYRMLLGALLLFLLYR